MRTNVDINDDLMKEVLAETGAKTKREAVDRGLRAFLRLERQKTALLALRGSVHWEGDLDAMRRDR